MPILLLKNNVDTVIKNLPVEYIELLKEKLIFKYNEYIFGKLVECSKQLYRLRSSSFPTGLINIVKDFLEEYNLDYQIQDISLPVETLNPLPVKKYLRPYQKHVLKKAIRKKRGIIQIATGGGKGLIIAAIAGKLNVNTIVVVNSSDLFTQIYDVLIEELSIPIGRIGCGIVDIKKINVCMIQTIHRVIGKKYIASEKELEDETDIKSKKQEILKLLDKIECVLVDEVHHLSSQSYVNLMRYLKNTPYRIGLSGTPWKGSGLDMVLVAYTGEAFCNITASVLIKKGFLVRPIIYMISSSSEYKNLLHLNYNTVYKRWVINNEVRNSLIINYAKKLYDSGRIILVTVNQISHGKIIKSSLDKQGVESKLIIGEIKPTVRKELFNQVRSKQLRLIICTSLADESIDIPCLDALILAGAGRSDIKIPQRVGRILRPFLDKKNAIVIDFYDRYTYLVGQSKHRLSLYKSEPEFIIKGNYLRNPKK